MNWTAIDWPIYISSKSHEFNMVSGTITGVYLKGVQTKANQTKNTRPMKDHLECTELREKLTV